MSKKSASGKSIIQQVSGQWPLAVVLVGIFVGLVTVSTSHWRLGSTMVGAAFSLGALLRLTLGKKAGLLNVRSMAVDVLILATVGIGILVLAWLVPPTQK